MKKNDSLPSVPASQSVLLTAIFDSSNDAIVVLSASDTVECWNPAACALFGYAGKEIIGNDFSFLLPSHDIQLAKPGKCLDESGVLSMSRTGKMTKSDGSIFEATLTITRLADQRDAGLVIIIKDMIGSRYEQELRESASHLKTIFDNAEEGFVLIDTEFIIKAFNSRAKESIVLNYGDTEVSVGKSILDYIESSRISFFKDVINKVLGGEPLQYDRPYFRQEGVTEWYHFVLNPVREGERITGICITGKNITENKAAAETIERNEKRFRGMVENSGESISILSSDGDPKYVSPSVSKILGYSDQEALHKNLFSFVHSEDLPKVKRMWEKVLANPGQTFYGNICRVLHSSGSWRWVDSTLTNMLHDPVISGIVNNFRDITRTINAERMLRVSEESYRYLFYNNPFPMWIYDPHSLRFVEVNNAAMEKYGYTRDEFLNLTLLDVRNCEDAEKLADAVNNRIGKAYNNGGVWKHKKKNGESMDVEISSHKIEYEGNNAVLVLINDVTEKNKAATLLLKTYNEKRNILESITDGFFTVDKNWNVTYWNKEAERILKMPRENILGKDLWEVYAMAKPLKFYSESSHALKEQVNVSFEEFFPPLGLWTDVSAYPTEDGLAVYFKDITEKKLIQESIRITKERYEMVARATNEALYEWDIVENVNYWSEGFETLFGHSRSEEKMPTESWTENLHPEEKEGLFAAAQEAFRNKKTSLSREMRFRCADGTYKTVFDKLAILYSPNGRPLKMVGAMQDISDRKKSELAIRELNKQLNKRAEELARSNEELERFAYVASHDLQEPLRMVSSFLQLLQKKYDTQLDEKANQYIEFAVDGAERMKRLILDLLEYSRVGSNKEQNADLNMNDIISVILKDFDTEREKSGAIVTVSSLPTIRANKTQIMQLFQNLVSNAFKYNTAEVPEIMISVEDKGNRWQFHIKDNGIGIDERFKEKVFVIFQRLHNKNQFSGTGIGLAICKKIVERHGGDIWVQSEPGCGSTFYFTIKK
jgi:PAS domain S-box-containing protein